MPCYFAGEINGLIVNIGLWCGLFATEKSRISQTVLRACHMLVEQKCADKVSMISYELRLTTDAAFEQLSFQEQGNRKNTHENPLKV